MWPSYWLNRLRTRSPSLGVEDSVEAGKAGRERLHISTHCVVKQDIIGDNLHWNVDPRQDAASKFFSRIIDDIAAEIDGAGRCVYSIV